MESAAPPGRAPWYRLTHPSCVSAKHSPEPGTVGHNEGQEATAAGAGSRQSVCRWPRVAWGGLWPAGLLWPGGLPETFEVRHPGLLLDPAACCAGSVAVSGRSPLQSPSLHPLLQCQVPGPPWLPRGLWCPACPAGGARDRVVPRVEVPELRPGHQASGPEAGTGPARRQHGDHLDGGHWPYWTGLSVTVLASALFVSPFVISSLVLSLSSIFLSSASLCPVSWLCAPPALRVLLPRGSEADWTTLRPRGAIP